MSEQIRAVIDKETQEQVDDIVEEHFNLDTSNMAFANRVRMALKARRQQLEEAKAEAEQNTQNSAQSPTGTLGRNQL